MSSAAYERRVAEEVVRQAKQWGMPASVTIQCDVTGSDEEPMLSVVWLSRSGEVLAQHELLIYTDVNPRDEPEPPEVAAAEFMELLSVVAMRAHPPVDGD